MPALCARPILGADPGILGTPSPTIRRGEPPVLDHLRLSAARRMAGTVGAGERRTPAGPLHSSAESAPPTISAKVSGGRATASSAQRKAVRRRPGGAPPPQSTSLKFCAVAGGWPTVFVSVPSPSAASATSSPGCSHLRDGSGKARPKLDASSFTSWAARAALRSRGRSGPRSNSRKA